MVNTLYWVHLPSHTDVTSQGYIGVTSNVVKRFIAHKHSARASKDDCPVLARAIRKYNDALIYTVLVKGTKEYCYLLENLLRPQRYVGWNVAKGGENSSGHTGHKHSSDAKYKMSVAKVGTKNYNHIGVWITPEGSFEDSRSAGVANKVSRTTIQDRCHSPRVKWNEWGLK